MKINILSTEFLKANKQYYILPLTVAVSALLFTVSGLAETPSNGDLSMYNSSNVTDKNPTLLLIVEGSTFTNNSDAPSADGLEIIGTPKSSAELYPTSLPVYDRNYYYKTATRERFYTRLTRMKDAIYYLMDTEGALPDNYRVGIGRYSSSTLSIKNIGDGLTGSINVPAKTLGPVSLSNDPSSQRYKIKKFVADMCSYDRLCTGNAPMAAAYAEAGSYMMGTKTGKLTYEPGGDKELSTEEATAEQIKAMRYTRVLRVKDRQWQYCPISSRVQTLYTTAQGNRVRIECPDDATILTENGPATKSYWVNVDKSNIADEDWADQDYVDGKKIDTDEPTNDEISSLTPVNGIDKTKYDLLWNGSKPWGADSSASNERISPKSLVLTDYSFTVDDFQNKNPTKTVPGGTADGWKYYIDHNLIPDKRLVPILRYRAIRQKYVGYNYFDSHGSKTPTHIWQYCPKDKAQLVNYIYSSYRLMCKDADWIDMAVYGTDGKVDLNSTNTRLSPYNVRWNGSYFPLITRGGRPHGIVGRDNVKNRQFTLDPLLNPYDGWQYWYDADYTQADYPPLPPTLNNGYSVSGMRNSPPEVRSHQSYTYQEPTYSECAGNVQYDSSGQTAAGAKTVENAIIFFTAGWPYSNIARPLNEMNMSLTPATSNDLNPVSGEMTRESCLASGLSEASSGSNSTINAPNNHWGCIGEYAKRLRMGKKIGNAAETYSNPVEVPIKTGVFMFTSNREAMTPVATDGDGLPKYNCASTTNISQRNACKLGQYGEGYGEGGFFQSTAFNTEESYQQLSKAFIKMTENLSSKTGLVPTSMPIVPANTFLSGKFLTTGYLPLIEPESSSYKAQWSGNLRKYNQTNNGFEDARGYSPFGSADNAILSVYTKDLWSKESLKYYSSMLKGGAYSQVPMPTTDTSETPRNVYLSKNSSGELTKYTPSNIQNATVAGLNSDEQNTVRRLLLNYMGYTINNYASTTPPIPVADITKTFSSGSNKTMGGVYHSTPIALIPKITRDNNNDYSIYKTFIMFGAMDNALHIVDDSTGVEVMSYFPQEVLANNKQYKAITPELIALEGEANPSFGVDGPWTSYASYDFGTNGEDSIVAKELYAYGGARLGAKAYYGINLTGLEKVDSTKGTTATNANTNIDTFKPEQLFTINPSTTGFSRLGYTWAKPIITNISWHGEPTLVAILSGGYDTEYDKVDAVREKEHESATSVSATLGNAIYVVNAKTGDLLITATAGSQTTDDAGFVGPSTVGGPIVVKNPNLKYSIPSSVNILDRDADELIDHLYFADLDGQIFRMDIDNIAAYNNSETKVRLIRLADLNTDSTDKIPGPRLYETPAVTIQEEGGHRFATVSVASGDRSNPLRINNPSNETAAVTVTYTDVLGNKNTLKASRKLTATGSATYVWEKVSGFSSDTSITLNATGTITIPHTARKKGTKVTATTIFLTTDNVSNTAKEVGSTEATGTSLDPLAPNVVISPNGSVTVSPSNTAGSRANKANYVYTIYDKDVASVNLFTTPISSLLTKNLEFTSSRIDGLVPDMSQTANVARSSYDKAGWRMPLKQFGKEFADPTDPDRVYQDNNTAIKAMGPISAIANKLYVSAYNPNDGKTDSTGCTAQVVGSTELYQFCLPYGICDDSYTVQHQRSEYGKGILPLSWSTDADGSRREIITQFEQTTTTDDNDSETKVTSTSSDLNGNGSTNTAPTFANSYSSQPILKRLKWFDFSE